MVSRFSLLEKRDRPVKIFFEIIDEPRANMSSGVTSAENTGESSSAAQERERRADASEKQLSRVTEQGKQADALIADSEGGQRSRGNDQGASERAPRYRCAGGRKSCRTGSVCHVT